MEVAFSLPFCRRFARAGPNGSSDVRAPPPEMGAEPPEFPAARRCPRGQDIAAEKMIARRGRTVTGHCDRYGAVRPWRVGCGLCDGLGQGIRAVI